jgi:HK97 gp10 family phage protein
MSVTVKLDMRKLEKLAHNHNADVNRVLGVLAVELEGDIKDKFSRQSPSPVGGPPGIDTGNLKNSIRAEQASAKVWVVAAYTDYAAYLEYGTGKMGARPYFRPAVKRLTQRFARAFKDVLDV